MLGLIFISCSKKIRKTGFPIKAYSEIGKISDWKFDYSTIDSIKVIEKYDTSRWYTVYGTYNLYSGAIEMDVNTYAKDSIQI